MQYPEYFTDEDIEYFEYEYNQYLDEIEELNMDMNAEYYSE